MGAPKEAPAKRYYAPVEVAAHSSPDDCWVSFHGSVYNLTELIKNNEGPLVQPVIKVAGSDISHWFDKTEESVEIKMYNDPVTNLRRPYCPMGRFLHVPPSEPVGDWDTSFEMPWWKDEAYKVGLLSLSMRKIRLKNVLTGQEDLMEVPAEETIEEIRERYLEFNWQAASYAWKVMKQVEGEWTFLGLDMELSLDENGVKDEAEDFEDLSIPNDFYIPVIHLYYTDDLTIA